ncbi:hypothetical protein C8A00DRAFT_45399 [Chaetomidium leptoderma]|uniref:Uncharacterized protein n=1 Tax=Chaetomidium leptoderma TaxID=669021 RepID=A0AAN6VHH6_9PEZI|nr:hypothetical protein C8A00DRAFT_45399 [Chaetomidium leptoderma]
MTRDTLLRLPPHLRHRIYLYTGVARFDRHPYTYYLDGRKESSSFKTNIDPPPARNFAGLLLSCRAVHAEVAALLYSANRFVIFYSRQGSLEPLRALSPTALASLATLKIVFNETACHYPVDSCDYPPYCCCDGPEDEQWGARYHCAQHHGSLHRHPLLNPGLDLTSTKPEVQAMLLEWHDTAAYLSSYVGIGSLALSLEVSWSRDVDGYQVVHPPCQLARESQCPPYILNGCLLSRCHLHYGCFCRRLHAAFAFECNCWGPPTGLFLICHTLRRDAEFVFFSGNRFIVHDVDATQPWALPGVELEGDIYPYKRFTASQFLRDIVPAHCLAHLRFLELVFSPFDPPGWPHNDHATVLDWCATVDWIRGKINAPALTIRFVMIDIYPLPGCSFRQALTEDEGIEILKGYERVMHPVKPLVRDDGLARFYVQAAYPWRWTDNTWRQIRQHGDRWLADAEQDLKEHCERAVRGRADNERLAAVV